jgi:hypothetical protein
VGSERYYFFQQKGHCAQFMNLYCNRLANMEDYNLSYSVADLGITEVANRKCDRCDAVLCMYVYRRGRPRTAIVPRWVRSCAVYCA